MSRKRRPLRLVISLALSAAVLLPCAFVFGPAAARWRQRRRTIAQIIDADAARRERALNEVIRGASRNGALVRGVAAAVARADPNNLMQMLNALRLGGALCDDFVVEAAAARMALLGHADLRRVHAVFRAADLAERPPIVAAIIDRLATAGEEDFLIYVGHIQNAGRWSVPPVPAGDFLRWLKMLAAATDAPTRKAAARRAGRTPSLARDEALHEILAQLSSDEDASVRHAALLSAARLAAGGDAGSFMHLIESAVGDSDAALARRAWILLGLAHEAGRVEVEALDPRPQVAEAMLWAVDWPHETVQQAIAEVADEAERRVLFGLGAFVAAQRGRAETRRAISARLTSCADRAVKVEPDESTTIMLWRCMLALRDLDGASPGPDTLAILDRFMVGHEGEAATQPLATIAAHCHGGAAPALTDSAVTDEVRWLAALEGPTPASQAVKLPDHASALVRVMAARASRTFEAPWLAPALAAQDPMLRDLACTIAAHRGEADQLETLIASLLNDYSDDAKRSGAVLAGLSGLHGKLLDARRQAEDVWSVQQIMRLGTWMQARPVRDDAGNLLDMQAASRAMLAREDLPATTVLLAILHDEGRSVRGAKQSRAAKLSPSTSEALAYLLDPRRSARLDLDDLLAERRWWYVLRHYLGDGAPPFDVWADAGLRSLQIEILRMWWLAQAG